MFVVVLVVVVFLISIESLEQREKIHGLDLQGFLVLNGSGIRPLIDLLESSRMLETPRRVPSVMLLSRKKELVDSVSKSDEESVEEVGEPVSIAVVLNDIDLK